MEELIARVSEQTGVPAVLVERSARARAQAEGLEVEEVLQAWAGGGSVERAAPAPEEPAAAEPPPEPEEEQVEEEEEEEEEEAPAEEPAPQPVAAAVPPAETPAEPYEEEDEEVVLVTASAGLLERRLDRIPRWLTLLFLVLPAYALFYTLVYAAGPDCGEAGRLAVDPETGRILNCDGTPYTPAGGPAGGPGGDFMALGGQVYASAPPPCVDCHRADGRGTQVFPRLSGGAVVETFPSCEDHVEWVSLGSIGWPGSTYGAQDKPKQGGMPGFGNTLSEEQIQAVVLFERVRFGGQPLEEALADCGLAEAEEEPAEGEEPAEDGEGAAPGEGQGGDAEGEEEPETTTTTGEGSGG